MNILILFVVVVALYAGMSYFLEQVIYKKTVTSQEVRAGFIYLSLIIAVLYALFDSFKKVC